MNKIKQYLLLSAFLSSTSAFANPPININQESDAKAALAYATQKQQKCDQYWKDFRKSNQPICIYIAEVSKKGTEGAEAALWFLKTGGKYGFSARKATDEEAMYVRKAIEQIAITASQNNGLFSDMEDAIGQGKFYMDEIHKKLATLEGTVLELRTELGEAKIKIIKLEGIVEKQDVRISGLETLNARIEANLAEEKKERLAEKEAHKAELAAQRVELRQELKADYKEFKMDLLEIKERSDLNMKEFIANLEKKYDRLEEKIAQERKEQERKEQEAKAEAERKALEAARIKEEKRARKLKEQEEQKAQWLKQQDEKMEALLAKVKAEAEQAAFQRGIETAMGLKQQGAQEEKERLSPKAPSHPSQAEDPIVPIVEERVASLTSSTGSGNAEQMAAPVADRVSSLTSSKSSFSDVGKKSTLETAGSGSSNEWAPLAAVLAHELQNAATLISDK